MRGSCESSAIMENFSIFGSRVKNVFQAISRTLAILPMVTLPPYIGSGHHGALCGDPAKFVSSNFPTLGYSDNSAHKCIESYGKVHAHEMSYRILWEIQLMNMYNPPKKYK